MNHKKILKRSWQILWSYKALWIFGFILAITTASGSSFNISNSANNSSGGNQNPMMGKSWEEAWEGAVQEFEHLFSEVIPNEIVTTAFTIGIVILCAIVVLIIITTIFRYMSETTLIQMVDRYEETGEKVSIREGFRFGFSRTAWKIFLTDLVINLPLILLGIFLLVMIFVPIFLLIPASDAAGFVGWIAVIGIFFLGIFTAIVITSILSLFKQFFRRAVAIEGLGVFDSIRFGFQLVRQNLLNVFLMWLITLGINIGIGIVLIPVTLIIVLISVGLGGAIGFTIGGLMSLISQGALPIVVGVMAGLPIFIILMVIPLGFLDGLRETYMSSVWTLTYREARALESLELEDLSLEFEADEPPSE